MFYLLPQRILYFPCYVEVSLDFKLERIKKNFPKVLQSILCWMNKLDLFLSRNVPLFVALTILIHHFALFFSIPCQKNKFYGKNEKQYSVKLHNLFLHILCWIDIYFKRLIIY